MNGEKVQWTIDSEAAGRPVLKIVIKAKPSTKVQISWSGERMSAQWMSKAKLGEIAGDFRQSVRGAFTLVGS